MYAGFRNGPSTCAPSTLAPGAVAAHHIDHLQAAHGCTVVGWSAKLADRVGLAEDLDAAQGYDVLLTELKAAAVDVAARHAMERGAGVVFLDNRPIGVDHEQDLGARIEDVVRSAKERYDQRT